MEYWTIKDGRHAGPFTAEQLADMGVLPDTPVWYEGLPDWVPAKDVDEISAIMMRRVNSAPQPPAQPEPYNAAPQPVQPYGAPQGATYYASHAPRVEPQAPATSRPEEDCPPAYLAWSIISLILCCLPLGVAAIIFSAQVKPAWRAGDYAKARRASERAQWCIILSMSVGLIAQIFYGVFSGAASL